MKSSWPFVLFVAASAIWALIVLPSANKQVLIAENKSYPHAAGFPVRAFTVKENVCCSGARDIRIQPLYLAVDLVFVWFIVGFLFLIGNSWLTKVTSLNGVVVAISIVLMLCGLVVLGITKDDDYHLSLISPYDISTMNCGQKASGC